MAGNIHKSQFNTSIKFEIDQASLASLKSALQDVSMAASKARFQGELTQELNDAAKAAEHLSTILTQSWNTKLNQFDLTKLNNSIKESYGSITALKNQLNAGGTAGAVAFNKIAQAVLSTNIQLKQSNEWLNKMAITMSNTIRFGISSSIMNNFTNSIQKAYNYVQKLDKSLNDIRIVSGASADQMDRFARYANNAAQKLGASTLDYTNAALIYFQQGLDEAEVKLRSDVTVKMSNVLGDSAEEVSNYMTAIWNNFAKGSDNLEYYADVLAKLGAETASSAEEISQGLEKFSAVADAVGLSYEYAAAALTTVTDRTRQSADVVGTAFKTLFARIQDLELGDEGTVTIGKYSEALEKFDIHVLDSEGNLKRMDDILNEMGAKWQTMSDAQKVALAQNVAGVRQYTQLMSLMENWDFFTQNVDSARDATGALQKQQEIYLDSVAAKLEQLGAEAEKFYSNLLDEKAIKSFASLLTTALKTINTYLTGLGGGLTGIGTLLLNGAGLFSGQIGKALAQRDSNKEIQKQNQANLKAQKEWLDIHADNEVSKASYEGLKLQTDYYKEILPYRDKMSEQDIITSNNNLKEIAELKEKITYAREWQAIATAANDGKRIETEQQMDEVIKKQSEHRAEVLEILNKTTQALEEYDEYAKEDEGGYYDSEDIEKLMTDQIKEAISYRKELTNWLDDNKEAEKEQREEYEKESKLLDHIIGKLKNRKTLTKEELELVKKGINQDLEKTTDKVSAMKGAKQGKKDLETGTTITDEARLGEVTSDQKKLADSNKTAIEYEKTIRGISTVFSSITASIGVIKTIFNPDLSAWEKIKSVFSVMVSQGFVLARNWQDIKQAGTDIAKWAAKRVAMMAAENAEKAKSVALGKVENMQQEKQVALEAAETAEDTAQSGLTFKETILNITKIIQQGIINALKAVEALLSGNITALGVATVAILATGIVALGKWIIHLIKINSEEVKLQKEIEETNNAVEKAKEAYKEISDTISNYKDARSGIDSLTEGTLEFYDAIIKSNEAAQILIDKLGLLANQDYTIDKNGLITIKEAALENAVFQEQQKIYRAQGDQAKAQTDYVGFRQQKIINDFAKSLTKETQNKGYQGIVTNEMAEKILKNSDETKYEIGKLVTTPKENLKQISESKNQKRNSFAADRFRDITEGTSSPNRKNSSQPSDNTIDISKLITKYLPAYQQTETKITNEEKLRAAYNIRGYGSREQVERYNSLTGRQQDLVNSYVAYQNQRTVNAVSSSDLSTKELKEKYAINALGYKYTQDKQSLINSKGLVLSDEDYDTLMDSIDKKTAKRAYDNGAYRASGNAEKILKTLETNKDNALKDKRGFNETSTNYISEILTGLKYGNLDEETFGKITNEEKSYLRDQVKKGNEEAAKKDQEANDGITTNPWKYTSEQIDEWLAASDTIGKSFERLKEEAKDYHNELESQAKALDTTAEALDFYAIAMDNAAGKQHEQNAETAKAAAEQYKFNKNYNDARKVYADNEKAINAYAKAQKNHQKISYDLADAMGELSQSLKSMGLSLSGESITKNLNLIKKLLKGTEKEAEDAYKELYKIGQMDTMKKFFGDPEDIKNADERKKKLKEYEDIIKGINAVDPGQNLDEKYAQKLSNMIDQTKLTVEQLRELSSELGIDIPVTLDVPNEMSMDQEEFTVKGSSTLHSYVGNMVNPAYDGNNDLYIPVNYKWVETVEDKTESYLHPKDTNFKVNRNTRNLGSNFKKASLGKANGGGGGSKSKPQKAEKFNPQEDIYHKVNTQITKVDNSLKKLQRQEEKTLGTKLLKNLQTQWNQISTQVDNYREKLKIAEKEQSKLQKKLAKSGVTFNEDGTVANYFETLQKLEDKIEAKRTKYNKERNKRSEKTNQNRLKEIETLKEQYNTLQEEMNRADELASDFIPGIKEAWNESLDQQVELNIKAFDLEVNLSLDLKDAQKSWNDFKEKMVNGLRDEDILGNAQLTQNNLRANLNSTTKDGKTILGGDLINQTQHVAEIMREIKLQEQDLANVYGNDVAAAYDALKEAVDKAKESYEEVAEYQKELHQSYLDMLDQAKDKLDKQKEGYSEISDLLEHNKHLVELTYGDKAYETLEEYYKLQKQNNKNELTTLAQQEKYYKTRMDAAKKEMDDAKKARDNAKEGTDQWKVLNSQYLETIEKFEKTKEHWTEAVENSNAALESSIEFAQESLENTINSITKTINTQLTGKQDGLGYAEEEWDLINKNSEQYLDTINRLQGQNDLESKYLDSINKATNPNIQKKLKNAMDNEMKSLREKDKLTQYDLDRANKRYQIMLAQIALEEAQENKNKMRLRRDSQGNYRYQYVADEENIQKAKEELSTLYTDLYNFDKERYKSTLSEIESTTREFEEKMAELAKINDPEERKEKEALLEKQYQQLLTAIQKEGEVARHNVTESAFDDLALLYENDEEEYNKMVANKEGTMAELIPEWESVNAAIQRTIEPSEYVTNLIERYKKAWEDTNKEILEYENLLEKIPETIKKFSDTDREATESLVEDNKKIIEKYEDNLKTLGDMITITDQLINKYGEEAIGIRTLIEAYKALEAQMLKNLDTYNKYASHPDMITDANEQNKAEDQKNELKANNNDSFKQTLSKLIPSLVNSNILLQEPIKSYLIGKGMGTSEDTFTKIVEETQKRLSIKKTGVWDKQTQDAVIARLNTGGYTGEWGNSGKLAFLHQKELVLNAQDTENILNTVAIMRNLMASMNESILSRLAGITAGSIQGLDSIGNNSGLEQNVHIEANFPNATSSNEIEEALRNLVNVASQRVTK